MYKSYKKYTRIALLITLPYGWYKLTKSNKDDVRNKSFAKGLELSQKFKKYPVWDKYVEMLLIRQFSILFIACDSFINGMVSDNENQIHVADELAKMKTNIIEELDGKNKKI